MLVQFTVSNFRSFDGPTTFSMRRTEGVEGHPSHVVENADGAGLAVLRGAAVYGANAAGKSNLVRAMDFARRLIVEGTRRDQRIPVQPFRLRPGAIREPSRFEFHFIHEGIRYNYGFAVTPARVEEEWLYRFIEDHEELLLNRTLSSDENQTLAIGEIVKAKFPEQANFFDIFERGVRPNQLALTEIVFSDFMLQSVFIAPFDWFVFNLLTVIPGDSGGIFARGLDLVVQGLQEKGFAERLTQFLIRSGTGVCGTSLVESIQPITSLLSEVPYEQRDEITYNLELFAEEDWIIVHTVSKVPVLARQNTQGQVTVKRLVLERVKSDGRQELFDIYDESDGTRKLISLFPLITRAGEHPVCLLVDELDSHFHTALSREFVRQFFAESGSLPGQIVFTTHDTNLLDPNLLRRDEIWFAEKAAGGATELYSLAEFKAGAELDVERGYLQGRFGAVPPAASPMIVPTTDPATGEGE
jgi:uncharacterized protein